MNFQFWEVQRSLFLSFLGCEISESRSDCINLKQPSVQQNDIFDLYVKFKEPIFFWVQRALHFSEPQMSLREIFYANSKTNGWEIQTRGVARG